ncbi:hypothetical protein Emag_007547 [Eimeria magna]
MTPGSPTVVSSEEVWDRENPLTDPKAPLQADKIKRIRRGGDAASLFSLLLLSGFITAVTVSFLAARCWRHATSFTESTKAAERRLSEDGPHAWSSLSDVCSEDSSPSSIGSNAVEAPFALGEASKGVYPFPKILNPDTKEELQAVLMRLKELALPHPPSQGLSESFQVSIGESSTA